MQRATTLGTLIGAFAWVATMASGCGEPNTGAADGATEVHHLDATDDSHVDVGDVVVLKDIDLDGTPDLGDTDGADDTEVADTAIDTFVPPQDPPELLLTPNALPPSLNGTFLLPSGSPYRIWVNRENFTLDLLSPRPADIDWSTLSLSCDSELVLPDGAVVGPGGALESHVQQYVSTGTATDGNQRRIYFSVDVDVDEMGEVTCTATVSNSLGSATSDTVFVVATLPPERDPFVQPDIWLVTLTRDIFSASFTLESDGTYTVASTHMPEGNGIDDFDEAFVGLGFFSETNLTARAIVKARLLARVRSEAYRIFGLDDSGQPTAEGVPMSLYFEGDVGAPTKSDWSPSGTLSMIALGGDGTPEDQVTGIVGRAKIDWNNQGVENNTVYDRGVYPTGIARSVLRQILGVLALTDFLSASGWPMGEHPDDAVLLDPDLDPATLSGDIVHRYELMNFAIDMVGLALATTLCHEIGHSLGLVPPGPPPTGMFAGMPNLDFIDNYIDGAHVDTGGVNIMQTGAVTNYAEAISQVPWFNPLNMAYLQRRIVILAD